VRGVGLPDKVTFHQLRHAFASRAAYRGVSKADLAEIMGHIEARTTELYVHLYGDEQEQREESFRQAMAQTQ
jgi:integrase